MTKSEASQFTRAIDKELLHKIRSKPKIQRCQPPIPSLCAFIISPKQRIIRLYNELDINLEGIEAINYLLQKISSLQDEIILLRNTLRLYEEEST